MSPGSSEDQPLSLRALARRVGVAESTLRSWGDVADRPLRITPAGGRSKTSTVADVRAFCAAHHERHRARRVAADLDSPTAAVGVESLRAVLDAVIAVVRATAEAQVELADTTAGTHKAHAATLTGALRGLDAALTSISPTGAASDGAAPR